MPYQHTTYLAFLQALAARLHDAGNVFWTYAELKQWTREALRTWNAYANYWRDRGTFVTAPTTPFYDITTLLKDGGGSLLLGQTETDATLVTQLEYHLLEPPTNPWTGTEMFTLSDLTGALTRRRDQFLSETGVVLTRSVINTPPNPIGRVPLTDTVIDVRRCAWIDTDSGVVSGLFRADELQADYGLPAWEANPGTPTIYSTIMVPPLTVQIVPPPVAKGQLDLLMVNSGAALDGSGVALGIPDDFAWTVKWGALADLLGRDGLARDPERAAYCEQRWAEGCELARVNPSVILAQIDGVDNIMDDLWAVATAMPNWQTTTGTPTAIATAGRNLLAAAPTPDGIYSVTLDVVRNAPLPSADTDYLQVGREVLDVLLDYALHLAAFKMGGAEWKATSRAAQNLLRQAAQYNEKLRASALFKEILWPTAERFAARQPRREPQQQPESAGVEA